MVGAVNKRDPLSLSRALPYFISSADLCSRMSAYALVIQEQGCAQKQMQICQRRYIQQVSLTTQHLIEAQLWLGCESWP